MWTHEKEKVLLFVPLSKTKMRCALCNARVQSSIIATAQNLYIKVKLRALVQKFHL